MPPIEPLGKIRTKIVATVGPASRSPESLRALIEAGVDLFRLNFSHATHDEHSETFAAIRAASEQTGRVVGVLQDLCGPKMRLGAIPGDEVVCNLGDTFRLVEEATPGEPHDLTCTYKTLPRDLKVGDSVLFADGTVAMQVQAVASGVATLEVTLPGRLRSHQGLNLPGSDLKVRPLTDKDLVDLDWTASHEVDYVGLSFVRTAWDVDLLRWELERRKCEAKIVVKIEKPQAVANLEAIVEKADAVMIARGDLGVEIDVAKVPAVQKRIIGVCHRYRRPVITATQMLASMETSNRPTRAEASDVFNAILDGTDAVMLSGETAIGEYPVEAVTTMSRIAAEAEALLRSFPYAPLPVADGCTHEQPVTESMVEAACVACRSLDAKLLIVATFHGRSALAVSKQRQPTPTLALTTSARGARVMTLYWGVTPVVVAEITGAVNALGTALDWARDHSIIAPGDHVALLVGTIPGVAVHNALLVEQVP
jgi:pyruvate kinase